MEWPQPGADPVPVLLIEDRHDVRQSLALLLESAGFQVVGASHGREALMMLRAGLRPCIIVMELMMPVMNGYEFRRQQLRDPSITDIPLIVMSEVTDLATTAAHLGANAYVQKSGDLTAFIGLVRKHCRKAP